jgi:hypothetical protein
MMSLAKARNLQGVEEPNWTIANYLNNSRRVEPCGGIMQSISKLFSY